MSFVDKQQYNDVAAEYLTLADVPQTKLEDELVKLCLGDCAGLRVLDLGGGSGSHARQALQAGATDIDVVDVSEQMLQIGKDIEAKNGRDVIQWHLADISKPMSHEAPSLPKAGYDIVIIIWAFDHATTIQELEGMWRNVSYYLRPGGRFVGLRVGNPRSKSAQSGEYGARFDKIEDIPDGVKYECVILAKPPFSFEATSMQTSYSGSFDVPRKFGLSDFKVVSAEETNIVKHDMNYWTTFLEDPHFVAFTAKKM